MAIIETKNLTKYYGKALGIKEVNISVKEGEIFGFIGPNGAGKSTTIRLLLSLIYPTSGEASLFGQDTIKHGPKVRERIGYLPSEIFYYDKMKVMCLLSMVVGVLVGARALNVAINWNYYMENRSRIFALNVSGFSLMGGLVLAGLLGILTSKIFKVPFWELGDAIAPGLGLGLIAMRLGCFLNACCYGLPTKLPGAVKYPYDSFAYRHYLEDHLAKGGFSIFKLVRSPGLHPTQIYEMVGALIATLVALIIIRKKKTKGLAALSFAFIFTLTRLINHFFRVHPSSNNVPFLFYPFVYLVIIIITCFIYSNRIY